MRRIQFDDMPAVEQMHERNDVSEGDVVVIKWSPYGWALDEGYVGRTYAYVSDVSDFVGDITLELPDGRTIKDLGESRAQVMGRAENSDVPNHTDVGRGTYYYPVPEHLRDDAQIALSEALA